MSRKANSEVPSSKLEGITGRKILKRVRMRSSHLNLRWSLKDIDDVQDMTRRRMDARSIAEAFLTTEDEIIALCVRNGFAVPPRRRNPVQGA